MLMMKNILYLTFFCTCAFSKEIVTHKTMKLGEQERIVTTKYSDDSENKGYTDFNLFTYHDNMTIEEEMHYRGKKIYSVTYNTIHYGFMTTKTNDNAQEHLGGETTGSLPSTFGGAVGVGIGRFVNDQVDCKK